MKDNYNKIFIDEKIWQKFTSEEMEQYVESVFQHYRRNGFPYFIYDVEKNRKKFQKLIKYNSNLWNEKTIKQTMHGLDIAWSYFPHAWEIECNGSITPMMVFNDDIMFRDAIKKRIKLGDAMSDNMIRKVLCIYNKAKRVSNFRPTAARAIYEKFDAKVVYDMSAGFGGRLLGAMSSKNSINYYGVDPSVKTFIGLQNLIKDLKDMFLGTAIVNQVGSEEYIPPEPIDMAFTSPPYFDTEKYSNEDTQSYIKYPSYNNWVNNFLGSTFENCHKALKNNGTMVINIANTSKYKNLENDTIDIANKIGFKLIDKNYLILSQVSKKTGYKTEPIYIFSKK